MRKITADIALIIMVVASTYGALLAYCKTYDHAGERTIQALIPILEEAKRVNGSYPVAIEETEAIRKAQVKVWGILPSPQVKYRLSGNEFIIYYTQRPFGPRYGYESKIKKWFFED